jgi:urease accessory protein
MRGSGPVLVLVGLAQSTACGAHGFGGSGLLHPLTGLDHALAMVAVGAWSAQLGRRAIYVVPACFVLLMLLGGIAGWAGMSVANPDGLIALSVLLLGLAIAFDRGLSVLPAGVAVGLFGFCHGFAHGTEMPKAGNSAVFIAGFLVTTAGLHLVGAVAALLLLHQSQGKRTLRILGALTAFIGVLLLFKTC